ncbi:MAG TPA: ATP-binding protein [Verrucomicrobiae bacterium]|nr:ATP-binding protein [Verrucomicrobiae bacterium]
MQAQHTERHLDPENEAIFRAVQAGILIMAAEGHVILDANPAALKLIGRQKEEVVGHCCHRFVCPAERGKCPITDLHTTVDSSERVLLNADGKSVPILKSVVPVELNGRPCLVECFLDLTERKRAEEDLKRAQGDLLQASRQAGMAEVATSVLHNVGNVLNSVNVSVDMLTGQIRQSKLGNLSRLVALIREHAQDLGAFMTQDPKGQQIPPYLEQLAQRQTQEQLALLKELESLRASIEHINDIVSMQQSYAHAAGVKQSVKPAELVEDALRMNSGTLGRHEIEIIRDFDPASVPEITAEKHKVLQILINLLRNAKYACDDSGRQDKCVTVRVTSDAEGIEISVTDNGVGVAPENLAKIFNYGFTTRKDGHGFGLHSAALAAKEMGGRLSVVSDGPGCGATFTLRLPRASKPVPPPAPAGSCAPQPN